MNTLWNKIWADLWLSKTRTLLAVASIAAGVFCVGTLFGMIDLQLAKMDTAHRQSQPSHISLILRTTQTLNCWNALKPFRCCRVDTMTQLTVRFRASGSVRLDMGTLIIRPDYILAKIRYNNPTIRQLAVGQSYRYRTLVGPIYRFKDRRQGRIRNNFRQSIFADRRGSAPSVCEAAKFRRTSPFFCDTSTAAAFRYTRQTPFGNCWCK